MNDKMSNLDEVLQAAEGKLQRLSETADRTGAALDALSQRIDARVDAVLAPKEARK